MARSFDYLFDYFYTYFDYIVLKQRSKDQKHKLESVNW